MRQYLFLFALAVLLACISVLLVRYTLRARKAKSASWQSLMSRLQRVNQENVALVALDLIQEDGQRRTGTWPELDADQVWNLVGGMEGLEKIEANCLVFIDMAVYLQHMHPEAVVVAEEFRRNTRHIQWHINRLRAGAKAGNLTSSFAEYAQRAVASYYLMSKQLVAVCAKLDFTGLEQVRAAV